MKILHLILSLVFLSSCVFAQTRNTVTIIYGATSTDVATYGADDYTYRITSGPMYGFTYTRSISKLFSIEVGLIFSDNHLTLSPKPFGQQLTGNPNGEVKMLSIPVYAKFTFFKYLFIDAGVSVDSQTNYQGSATFEQSGFGAEAGIGGKYSFGRVTLSVNPFIFDHSVFFLGKTSSNNQLVETGVKFGLGYNF
jgi:hypothetical protein